MSFPLKKNPKTSKPTMLWQVSPKNHFFSVPGEREVFTLFFFCNSQAANAEVALQEIFMWILASLQGGFLFFWNGTEKSCLCNSFWLPRPHSRAFSDMSLFLGKVVILHVNLGVSHQILLLENMSHSSFCFFGGGKGDALSCLIRRLKLLKVATDL